MVKKFGLENVGIAEDPVKWEHICRVPFSYIYFSYVGCLALPVERGPRDIFERLGS